MADDFLILGDLTERVMGEYVDAKRKLLVRMFVGSAAYDEEIEVDSERDISSAIAKRMAALKKKPGKGVQAEFPEQHPGHAILLES